MCTQINIPQGGITASTFLQWNQFLKAGRRWSPKIGQCVKLRELELNHKLEWQKLLIQERIQEQAQETQQILAINKTMQEESRSEHWPQWFWRPYWGLISGSSFGFVCAFVCYLGYKAIVLKDSNAIGMIPIVIGAFTTLFGIPGAILGIAAWGRNKLKLQAQPAAQMQAQQIQKSEASF